jgi:hypothetical protein
MSKDQKTTAPVEKKKIIPLSEILKFAGITEDQLCEMLSERTVANRKIKNWDRNQSNRGTILSRRESALLKREKAIDVDEIEHRVKMKKLKVDEADLDVRIFSHHEMEQVLAGEIIRAIEPVFMPKKISSGEEQYVDKYLRAKFLEAKRMFDLIPPEIEDEKLDLDAK